MNILAKYFFPDLSPLARGTHQRTGTARPPIRFIPAGAGNTSRGQNYQGDFPVYPRWRGEHFCLADVLAEDRGLSPLARGTRSPDRYPIFYGRFIPAGAGNTKSALGCRSASAVYPRWRGEHITMTAQRRSCCGLSPLARGTLLHGVYSARARGTR